MTYSIAFKVLIVIIQAIGTFLTPIYLLSILRQMFYGYKSLEISIPYFKDAGPREIFVSICLFLPVIGIGIYPRFVSFIWSNETNYLLSQGFS